MERWARWWLAPEEKTFRDGAAPVGDTMALKGAEGVAGRWERPWGHGSEAVVPRRVAWQVSSPVLIRGDAAPLLEGTRHPVGDMAWKRSIRSVVETSHMAHARCIVIRTILPPARSDNGGRSVYRSL